MRVRKPWVRARLTLEGWYVRFMINPGGPTGLVTGLSAVKLHVAIRMILAAAKNLQPIWQVSKTRKTPAGSGHMNSLRNHKQSHTGSLKPLRIGKTRDYHRFLTASKKASIGSGFGKLNYGLRN